jgi:hypothetical protein
VGRGSRPGIRARFGILLTCLTSLPDKRSARLPAAGVQLPAWLGSRKPDVGDRLPVAEMRVVRIASLPQPPAMSDRRLLEPRVIGCAASARRPRRRPALHSRGTQAL